MTGSVPWSVNAVDPEAWANARDAARREGLSVGEWLEATIRDAAGQQERGARRGSRGPSADVFERRLDDIADRLDLAARRASEPASAPRAARSDSALHHSIDGLTERIERLAREVSAGDRHGPSEIRTAIQRLEDRIDDLATRERLASASVPAELERKLETISRTIESMGRRLEIENNRYAATAVPASVDELDYAVAEIMMRQSALDGVPPPRELRRPLPEHRGPDLSGLESQLRLITEEMQAMRRASTQTESIDALRREFRQLAGKLNELAPRHSLASLEAAIESVAQRVDRASIARSDETLSEVVDALHDIRSALAEVRPAESFKSVERDLQELSSKLDNLNIKGVDERTVARLQQQTTEIRDLLSSALPSDVLKALVDQIELLVHKFEDGGIGSNNAVIDVLEGLERRIDALSERIDAASREGPSPAAIDDIRARLDDLQEAVTSTERRSEPNFESALRAIAAKIDATDARLGNLGSIERGLKELAAQLQEVRASTIEAFAKSAIQPPHEAAAPEPARPHWAEPLADKPEIAAEPRIVAVRPEARTPAIPSRFVPAVETPGGIPADFPLEPGSGVPRFSSPDATPRSARSEAAPGEIAPPTANEEGMRTSDFIAAARRAAQAAAAEPAGSPAVRSTAATPKGIGSVFGNKRRSLLIALAAFLVIFVALRFFDGQSLLPFRSPSAPAPKASSTQTPPPVSPAPAAPQPQPEGQSNLPAPADALAALPPAGVIGSGHDLSFLNEGADPNTTGSTATAKPAGAIQTAAAPAGTEAAPEGEGGLPAALGTPALRAAAVAGDPVAAYEIGVRYLEGRGVRASIAEAASWLERAAAKGSMPAAYRLGSIHEKGSGAAKNSAEAMRYYTIAAEGGNIKAMHNLAVMIAEGTDGKPDYRAASRWFRMAAERGVRDSQYNLGVLYARGLGVEQNFAESYRWFSLAANQGDNDAGAKRDDVAKRLDVQSLVAAKLSVQTWQPAATKADANEIRLKPEWDKAEAAPRKRTVKK
ncbi:MAG: SEL1-like repeat protein [Bradyrhizobiaceae bacterium]|nr:SEL1-like repeat protein [Bradyrhizobiaceae bacterium]